MWHWGKRRGKILMRILIYGAGVIGEKSMKNEEYKKLSIKEFTKAAGRYESLCCAKTCL